MITAEKLKARHDQQQLTAEERIAEILRAIQGHIIESGVAVSPARGSRRAMKYLTHALAELWLYYGEVASSLSLHLDSIPPSRPPLRVVGGRS